MSPYRQSGFTMVELMVTVAVLAILAGIALPSFQASLRSNRAATTRANVVLPAPGVATAKKSRGCACT